MTIEQSFNFRQASSNITTSGVVGSESLSALAAEGYSVLINLLPDDSKYAVPDEQTIVESQGIRYVYIPVDFTRPTLGDYDRFVEAMEGAEGQQIHVHCAANYRVSAFFSLYAESKGMWSSAEANEFVADLWNPAEHDSWPDFMNSVRARIAAAKTGVASNAADLRR